MNIQVKMQVRYRVRVKFNIKQLRLHISFNQNSLLAKIKLKKVDRHLTSFYIYRY